jgi:rod shape-determining protein MreC
VNKSTSFLVVLLVGCGLILVCFLLPETITKSMRKDAMEVTGPVLRTAERPLGWFSRVDSKLKTLDQAQVQITALQRQLAELQLRNQLLSDRDTENRRLREMLGFQAASKYELLPCRVVSREPSSWWTTVQINVGWENNKDLDKKFQGKYSLTSDQPVVSPRGVVGKTGNVSRWVTDVILLVDKNCSISATIEDSHDQGIVKGQGNFEEGAPRVLVDYLPKNSQVKVNDFIVTSGLGPYFPAGLRLGTVIDVPPVMNEYPTFGMYRQAYIEPTADLNQLDELFIVLGPKQGDAGQAGTDSTANATSPASADAAASSPTNAAGGDPTH